MEIVLVWAQARSGAIGRDGAMPWHLPEDLAHFRRTTRGAPVVMGRRTWESLPEGYRPLPDRENRVVTRDAGFSAPGALVSGSLPEALAAAAGGGDRGRICVIGGGQLYRAAMPLATELVVTEIELDVPDADTFAPEIGSEWRIADPGEPLVAANGLVYRVRRFRRASPPGGSAAAGRVP